MIKPRSINQFEPAYGRCSGNLLQHDVLLLKRLIGR